MLKYIAKRILVFIPTIIAISLLTFLLSLNAPGDPVENMLSGGQQGEGQLSNKLAGEQAYREKRKELGLDLPIFYFSFSNYATPDSLYKIEKSEHRKTLERLLYIYGNWDHISKYYSSLRRFEYKLLQVNKDSTNAEALIKVRGLSSQLFTIYSDTRIRLTLDELKSIFNAFNSSQEQSYRITQSRKNIDLMLSSSPELIECNAILQEIDDAYSSMKNNATRWKNYIPVMNFYGLNNQYHNWISKFVQGDFGISYQDKREVSTVIWDALRWTLMISMIAILITYLIAVPLGVNSAVHKGSKRDQIVTTSLFILYSLPTFWIATMLVMFFGGGDFYDVFPPYGLGDLGPEDPWIERFFETAYHLVLPLICLTYPTFAFLSRQSRGGMLNVLNQDYIRTARAKGLADNTVIWKHSFRNALLPIITLFANVFPHAIAGSVVLEIIFSIPGMGKVAFEAIFARNYPIVFTVVMFSAILTLVGYLVADILYAFVDPRISYGNKKA